MELAEIAAELYGLAPDEFVAARTARVKSARAECDRALARDIAALRKPALAAWVVNIAARELPAELDALLAVGDALRTAQQTLSGEELRRLNTQRQQVVRVFTQQAGAAAAARGHPASDATLRDVAQTLHAALADPAVAQQVRAGTLVAAASYSGFGPAALTAVTDPGPSAKTEEAQPVSPKPENGADRAQRLAQARAAAAHALDDARAALRAARGQLGAADAEIARLRAELDHAEQARQFVRSAERAAAEQLRKAEREFERAQRAAGDSGPDA